MNGLDPEYHVQYKRFANAKKVFQIVTVLIAFGVRRLNSIQRRRSNLDYKSVGGD